MAEVLTVPKKGIWQAVRLTADAKEIPYCDLCTERIEIGLIYAERTTNEPLVVCQVCTSDILDARLQLIGQGG